MTEASGIDAEELLTQLPDDWQVDDSDAGVYGYLGPDEAADALNTDGIPACFSIQPGQTMWTATWQTLYGPGDEGSLASQHLSATRERCIAWVAQQAQSFYDRAKR